MLSRHFSLVFSSLLVALPLLEAAEDSALGEPQLVPGVHHKGLGVLVAGQQAKPGQQLHHRQLHLQHGEAHADAGARALPEAEEGVGVARCARLPTEVVRVEGLGVGVVPLVQLQNVTRSERPEYATNAGV